MQQAWIAGLAGGALIGVAAMALWWGLGRIAGVSGIVGGVLQPAPGDVAWRVAFVLGLVAGAWALRAFGTGAQPSAFAPIGLMLVAGALVGAGTRMGNGCTSGHGVCGLGRLSRRSVVAVALFMGTAIAVRAAWIALAPGSAP